MGRWRTSLSLAFMLLAACQAHQSAPGGQGGSPPVTTSTTYKVDNDFTIPGGASPGDRMHGIENDTVRAGHGSVAIFAIERPRQPGKCVTAAQLRVNVIEASASAQTQLALYPSLIFNAAAKKDGSTYGYSETLLDIRPRSTLDAPAQGWTSWDITDIVKLWLRGGPFPSRGRRPPEDGDVILALHDVDARPPYGTLKVSSIEGVKKPYVIVTHEKRCPNS